MQDTKYASRIDLSKYYSKENLFNLYKVFPKLKPNSSKANSFQDNYYVDKYFFYQTVLAKIKTYFEINQTFIVSETISILLNDVQSIIGQNKTTILPLINTRSNDIKDTSEMKRCLSTKSNGKKKLKENSKGKTCYSGFDFVKEKRNLLEINNVYLNLDNKNNNNIDTIQLPKLKMVHFMNEEIKTNKNSKNEMNNNTKKSNLKKNKKESNINTINLIDVNYSLFTEPTSCSRDSSLNKTETVNTERNKSNGKKSEKNSNIKIIKNKSVSFNAPNKNGEILYDKIKMNDSYNDINSTNFDIFDFSIIVGKENALPLISNYIFTLYNFSEFMNLKKFRNFSQKISLGYINTNHYHNCIHAGDVLHTCFMYFKEGGINEKIGLNSKSLCALYLSCICHDYKHPGLNNNFLIETKNPIAIKYNDVSVLENMHISETFNLINSNNDCNIFQDMDTNDYKIFRKQMINCVLATDMTHHNKSLDFMKQCLNENYNHTEEDNLNYMKLLVHSADISNPTKKFNTYYKWANLIMEEFYYQGDKEKELGLKCSCDRNTVTIYKSQLGFIDYVVNPFCELFVKVFPKLKYLKNNMDENWKKIKEMEEEENKK